jgi:hypothetical protein
VVTVEEDELVQLLEEFEGLLEELGYTPIVEQERRAAVEGRPVETTKDDRSRSRASKSPRPEVGDVRRAPLSISERFAMLCDLVEVAVGSTFAIQERVLEFMEENFSIPTGQTPVATFRPDPEEGFALDDDRSWSLPSRALLETRRPDVRDVLTELQQLREAVGVERASVLALERDHQERRADLTLGWA